MPILHIKDERLKMKMWTDSKEDSIQRDILISDVSCSVKHEMERYR
jgi:hypothetical protein